MSSLAASRADNFYHPPEWDPSKESRKKFQNNKGKNQYETDGIIRFELPMDAWCSGCERHYGKGTRWNAKKEADGKYFSTKIFKFTMTCHSCPVTIVIATDPKNSDYEFREGLVKKTEEPDDDGEMDEVNQKVQASVDSIYKVGGHAAEQEREYKRTNRMYKLEHDEDDKKRALSEAERFENMLSQGVIRRRYDYDANAVMRSEMRVKRVAAKALETAREERQLSIPLLEVNEEDIKEAKVIMKKHQRRITHSKTEEKKLIKFQPQQRHQQWKDEDKSCLNFTTSSAVQNNVTKMKKKIKKKLIQKRSSADMWQEASESNECKLPEYGQTSGLSALACYNGDSDD